MSVIYWQQCHVRFTGVQYLLTVMDKSKSVPSEFYHNEKLCSEFSICVTTL